MSDSPLFSKLGRELCTGSKAALVVFKSKAEMDSIPASSFVSSVNPNTIYISFGKSAPALQKSGADLSLINWVDASGEIYYKASPLKAATNLSFVENPRALTHLSMIISGMASSGNFSFVVLDSVNDLLAANGEEKTLKFLFFLVKKFEHLHIGALFFAVQDAKFKEFFADVSRECGKAVKA